MMNAQQEKDMHFDESGSMGKEKLLLDIIQEGGTTPAPVKDAIQSIAMNLAEKQGLVVCITDGEPLPQLPAAILQGIPTSVDSWYLFDMPDVDKVALDIAQQLSDKIREVFKPELAFDLQARLIAHDKVYNHMYKLLTIYSDFGASDTEARTVLWKLLRQAFNVHN